MTPAPRPGDVVRIDYRRPPDRLEVFEQRLVARRDDVLVTLLPAADLPRPMRLDGRVALEPGSPIVWFTFPGAWHDIGRFHDAAGRFTGLYANVLTPVELEDPAHWRTTDLFLDVWIGGGEPALMDEDELDRAIARGWVDAATADAARAEAARLMRDARAGRWPPPVVDAWPLERAAAAAGVALPGRGSA